MRLRPFMTSEWRRPCSYVKLRQLLTLNSMDSLKISEYSATSIKKTVTGVGRADKNQIATMIKILLPKANFKSEDEADALAVAICHNNKTF